MLTPEREKEIRKTNSECGPSIICNELLAEIDRLRRENKALSELRNMDAKSFTEWVQCYDELREKLAVAVKALEKSVTLTMLPHQISHDELIGSCNENVQNAQQALAKTRGEKC